MSTTFLVSLVVVVAAAFTARWASAALPLRRAAQPMSAAQAVMGAVGLSGLAFHCAAMFFRQAVALLPGSEAISDDIRALGTASVIWYVVPAVLVVLALRRQHPAAVALVALALTGVGVTMYNGGPLQVHLAAIFTSVLVIATVMALLVIPPLPRRQLVTS